jgi:hypothetical protein
MEWDKSLPRDRMPSPVGWVFLLSFSSGWRQKGSQVMITESRRDCPSCGNELSGGMEFCPVCMLRQGPASGVQSGEPSASDDRFKASTPEQAAQRFEHFELVTRLCIAREHFAH